MPILRDTADSNDRVYFIDDGAETAQINGHKVVSFAQFLEIEADEKRVAIAIADGRTRAQIAQKCEAHDLGFLTLKARGMVLMDDVAIGEGSIFSPFTTVTSNIRIGKHFHCNLYSYVEHDCRVGNFVTFAPGVCCNGNVIIGDYAYIGSNAVIRQGITIGAGATVGMGAVVTRDVPEGETWVGNPAKAISRMSAT
jgi:sugar O-acyltransferase (sialic acid O-acetyltransferase NeuD family)